MTQATTLSNELGAVQGDIGKVRRLSRRGDSPW